MKDKPLFIAAILALVLTVVLMVRVTAVKSRFDGTVKEAYRTSEGYDQKFIDMVNRLEDVLATRARFGYPGGKDPMTGQERQIVTMQQPAPKRVRTGAPVQAAGPAADPLKLTAVIFDNNTKKYTGVMMDDERSFSVEENDMIKGRKVLKITENGIMMEGENMLYIYDIHGNKLTKPKTTQEMEKINPQPQKGRKR